jgi:DNA adenine methylase
MIPDPDARGPLPHPVPYQGSKRKLAGRIMALLQGEPIRHLHEPFAGSAAFTLAAARQGLARQFFINDSLAPLAALWGGIIDAPEQLARRYEALWAGHAADALGNFYKVRAEFNQDREPAKLLYLLARCVKSAVRFNDRGEFNQSADKRRLGTRPPRMRREILAAHALLRGRTTSTNLDYAQAMGDASRSDVVYLDPPWQGTSGRRDTRYHQILDLPRLIGQLGDLNRRGVPFLLSFDGRLGDKTYGEALPEELDLARIELAAGRSAQATLSGRTDETVESLYVSRNIIGRLESRGLAHLIGS